MILLFLLALAVSDPAGPPPPKDAPVTDSKAGPGHSPDHIPARDGDVAIRQEFEAAARANTVEAWNLFIARHPGHALIETARAERRKLLAGKP